MEVTRWTLVKIASTIPQTKIAWRTSSLGKSKVSLGRPNRTFQINQAISESDPELTVANFGHYWQVNRGKNLFLSPGSP
ncbi:hypothetical protein [Microvirga sp. Mcv34]|uniref:hypothetical protein n=1 Tax=Microvirga sp. Mcv34 TaxID=2926016 RepID=UPI0021C6E9AC|nr:hypothetical protein [Microvirga sp. Mcv34]